LNHVSLYGAAQPVEIVEPQPYLQPQARELKRIERGSNACRIIII